VSVFVIEKRVLCRICLKGIQKKDLNRMAAKKSLEVITWNLD
jgi:hypothetical protein